MATSRDTFSASVATAGAAKVATNIATSTTHQESVAASKTNVGYTGATGSFAALDLATRNANLTYAAQRNTAEMTRQTAIGAAKATLRATGDRAPV